MSNKDFFAAIEGRRSHYALSNEKIVSEERIHELVNHAVLNTPSSFNSQSGRVVVLLGDQHKKLWEITTDTLKKIVPAEQFGSTQEKMDAFGAGYGTILFFEDNAVVKGLQEQFPLYSEKFPIWSRESGGMLQYVIWTALEVEGLGASLQHYNPLIDDAVKAEWNIPASWELNAQMPFGKPLATPGEKASNPVEDRVKVYK